MPKPLNLEEHLRRILQTIADRHTRRLRQDNSIPAREIVPLAYAEGMEAIRVIVAKVSRGMGLRMPVPDLVARARTGPSGPYIELTAELSVEQNSSPSIDDPPQEE